MLPLPLALNTFFVATVILTAFFFYKASNNSNRFLLFAFIWLAAQATLAITGFYTVTNSIPPRFMLLPLPPLLFILVLFFTKKGKQYIKWLDVKTLTLLHIVRVPVELTFYWLFLHKVVPKTMTFEDKNIDILSGLTAPLIYYFGYVKERISKRRILIWNLICLFLLIHAVAVAIYSAPFPFQKYGFEQPNKALFYFPYIWLPCFIVPIVLFAHLVCIKNILGFITLDERTLASHPGAIKISIKKFLAYKSIHGLKNIYYRVVLMLPKQYLFLRFKNDKVVDEWIEKTEQFKYGCINPSVIINKNKGIVATYTDLANSDKAAREPVIKIWKEKLELIDNTYISSGQKVSTVSTYSSDKEDSEANAWANFHPNIPNCFTDDLQQCETAMQQLNEIAWRCLEIGLDQIKDKEALGLYYIEIDEDMVYEAWEK
jgi:uncharacterized protein DUF3239